MSKWLMSRGHGYDDEAAGSYSKHTVSRERTVPTEDEAVEMKIHRRRPRHVSDRQLSNWLMRGTSVRPIVDQNDSDEGYITSDSDVNQWQQEDEMADEPGIDTLPPEGRVGRMELSDDDQQENPIEEYQFSGGTVNRKSYIPISASSADNEMKSLAVVMTSSKRGFNDIADMCVTHNCSGKIPGTVEYIRCMRQFRCTRAS